MTFGDSLAMTRNDHFSLKHPAKYIGRKPRKYTIPAKPLVPRQQPDGSAPGGDQVRMDHGVRFIIFFYIYLTRAHTMTMRIKL
jgi:hypothetical protein